MTTKIVTQLDTMEHEDISQLALDYLTQLLHKVSMNQAANMLRTTPPTLYRWLDESKPLESVSIIAASYIVLMCETNRKFIGVLDQPPRNTAYYGGK